MAQYAASLSQSPTTYVNSPGGHSDTNSPASSNTLFNSAGGHFSRSSPSKESDVTYVERERTWGQQDRTWITASNELPGQCPAKRRRTIVLCFDGTGDQFDGDVGFFRVAFLYQPMKTMFAEFKCGTVLSYAQEG